MHAVSKLMPRVAFGFGSWRRARCVLVLAVLGAACRRPDLAPPERSDVHAAADAGAGNVPTNASTDAAVALAVSKDAASRARDVRACAEPRDPMALDDVYYAPVSTAALRPVARMLFPADQRKAKRRSSFEAPERVAFQGTGGDALLVLGDADWSTCEIFTPADRVQGPFAGAPASAEWTARVYRGIHRVVLVVSDAQARVRALRAFEVGQVSCGFSVERLEAFSDGALLSVSSYVSADGDSLMERGVYGLFGGSLEELYLATAAEPTGAVDAFTVTTGPAGARPTLTVRLKAHPAPKSEPLGEMSKAIDRTRNVTWDPKTRTFR